MYMYLTALLYYVRGSPTVGSAAAGSAQWFSEEHLPRKERRGRMLSLSDHQAHAAALLLALAVTTILLRPPAKKRQQGSVTAHAFRLGS